LHCFSFGNRTVQEIKKYNGAVEKYYASGKNKYVIIKIDILFATLFPINTLTIGIGANN